MRNDAPPPLQSSWRPFLTQQVLKYASEDWRASSKFCNEPRSPTLRDEVIGIFHRDVVEKNARIPTMRVLDIEDVGLWCSEASHRQTAWRSFEPGR